ncbi:MAG: cytochrome c biogenesis protein ResB [Deltaproteobacteria bacterium]|jgi:cytochrome c biogenesis protein|nr:cytochrome c biogenesis protein ResB [Deltaproteobacteria bacterium]
MKSKKNSFWEFFASVKLALFCFFTLAIASIAGTIIPQNKPYEFYLGKYGDALAEMFRLLDIPNMYNSWWFISLLSLFSINLIICSIERLPTVWKIVTMDNLATKVNRLEKMTPRVRFGTVQPKQEVVTQVEQTMKASGWKPTQGEREGGTLLFAQKTPWVRFGVYIVHSSILVIFLGAIIGILFGAKGSIMLREKGQVPFFYAFDTSERIPLGFDIRCDDFTLTYYDNGAPKEYRSELTVLENGQEVLKKAIVVNDPLDYKGYTFYQASYEAMNDFWITVQNQNTGARQLFLAQPGVEIKWREAGINFGIVNMLQPDRWGRYRLKIWFSDGKGEPSVFWLDGKTVVTVERPDAPFAFKSEQVFATGLQVAKDPGVWPVYIGCILMLVGLVVAFFLSHKRLWVYVYEEEGKTRILVAGSSNKNKVGFENMFNALVEKLEENESLQLSKV